MTRGGIFGHAGRPRSIDGAAFCGFRASPKLVEAAKADAASRGVNLSEFIRAAIEELIKRKGC